MKPSCSNPSGLISRLTDEPTITAHPSLSPVSSSIEFCTRSRIPGTVKGIRPQRGEGAAPNNIAPQDTNSSPWTAKTRWRCYAESIYIAPRGTCRRRGHSFRFVLFYFALRIVCSLRLPDTVLLPRLEYVWFFGTFCFLSLVLRKQSPMYQKIILMHNLCRGAVKLSARKMAIEVHHRRCLLCARREMLPSSTTWWSWRVYQGQN